MKLPTQNTEEAYKTLKNYVALADYLESFFDSKVDLVTVESLDPYIRPYILNEVVWTPRLQDLPEAYF
jgi:uncharacterized protein